LFRNIDTHILLGGETRFKIANSPVFYMQCTWHSQPESMHRKVNYTNCRMAPTGMHQICHNLRTTHQHNHKSHRIISEKYTAEITIHTLLMYGNFKPSLQ